MRRRDLIGSVSAIAALAGLPAIARAAPGLPPATAGIGVSVNGGKISAAPFVTARGPTATDDSTLGYAANDIWHAPGIGNWYAVSVTAGAAVWAPINAPNAAQAWGTYFPIGNVKPVDLVGGAAWAGGTVKLTGLYTGNAIQLTRGDGTTLDVGFTADGYIDYAAADAFASGHIAKITKVYDQSFGGVLADGAFVSAGTGYTSIPTVAFGNGATCTATVLMKVVSATVAAGGTGGTPGAVTLTGTTGTGTKFQATGTISVGGILTGALVITVGGSYSVLPASLTAAPVTGGGLTGCTLNIKMGCSSLTVTGAGADVTSTTPMTLTGGSPTTAATPGACSVTWTARANDAVGVFATAPIWTNNRINGRRVITFSFYTPGVAGTNVSQFVTIPDTMSITPLKSKLYAAAQTTGATQTDMLLVLGVSGFRTFGAGQSSLTSSQMNANSTVTATPVVNTPAVFGWDLSNLAWVTHCNNYTNTQGTGSSGTPVVGGTLGSATQSGVLAFPSHDLGAMVLYNRTFSAGESLAVRGSLMRLFDVTPQVKDMFVMDGDSIAWGWGNSSGMSLGRLMLPLLNKPVTLINGGHPGDTILQRTSAVARTVENLYSSLARNFVVLCAGGTNDIALGASAATTYTRLQDYVTAMRAACPNAKIIVQTILPRTSNDNAIVLAYNASVRAGWRSFADGLLDSELDATIGNPSFATPPTAPANTALYPDGTHLSEWGLGIYAQDAAVAVNRLLV